MQIKTTRYYFIPTRILTKKWKILIIGEDVEKLEPTDGNGKMV